MTELRFHRDIYSGEAVKTWSNFAEFTLRESDEHWIVDITPKHEAAATRIIGEFRNYVLGLTVDRGGV